MSGGGGSSGGSGRFFFRFVVIGRFRFFIGVFDRSVRGISFFRRFGFNVGGDDVDGVVCDDIFVGIFNN